MLDIAEKPPKRANLLVYVITMPVYQKSSLSPDQIAVRKRYIAATVVSCVVLAMLAGTVHVVRLGANRMQDMRNKASYDLKDMPSKLRAAGEDIMRHGDNETRKVSIDYNAAQVNSLLTPEQWRELDMMVSIPPGEFTMGTDYERSDVQNRPQHQVTLGAYAIDKYLVTNAQYARFVVAANHRPPLHWENGRIPPGLEMHPVTMVSWYDAAAYAKWAGKRLPTEAEWEKTARGTDSRRWPWGEKMEPKRLNTYYNVGSTTPVTAYPSGVSPYGALDMAGNVSQWIADDFVPYAGSDAPPEVFAAKIAQVNTPSDKAMKVVDLVPVDRKYKGLRGGSWKSDPFSTATYHRNFSWPHYASDFFGFRCVQDAGPFKEKNHD